MGAAGRRARSRLRHFDGSTKLRITRTAPVTAHDLSRRERYYAAVRTRRDEHPRQCSVVHLRKSPHDAWNESQEHLPAELDKLRILGKGGHARRGCRCGRTSPVRRNTGRHIGAPLPSSLCSCDEGGGQRATPAQLRGNRAERLEHPTRYISRPNVLRSTREARSC